MKKVIGIIGEMGSGKGTFIKILTSIAGLEAFGKVSTSGFLRNALSLWGLELTRENLQLLPQIMKNSFGPDTFFDAIAHEIDSQKQTIVIFDGPRFNADILYLKSKYELVLVYIETDIKTRFERIIERGEKQGENITSFEKFLEQHKAPTESEIPFLKTQATYVIDNNGDLENLEQQTKTFYEKFIADSNSQASI